ITFTVSLTNTADHDVTVAYHLVNGTAVAGSDFTDGSGGTVTILAGHTSADISVSVLNDSVFESPEAFTAVLDSATYDKGGANQTALSITDTTGTGNIADNDQPTVAIADGAPNPTTEGGTITFTVSLTNTADHDVTVAYHLVNGTAVAGSDFTDGSGGTVTILAGHTSADISVSVLNDSVFESPEAFTAVLDSATYDKGGANQTALSITDTTGTGNIADNDTSTWSISGSASVTEGNAASYTLHLAGALQTGETATINLALADISTTSADYANFAAAVTAAIGSRTDLAFNSGTGTLTFTGTGSPMSDLVISLGTVNDTALEDNEQFKVSLASPGSGTGSSIALDPTHASVTTTIIDNDPKAGAAITLEVNEAALSTGSNPSLTTETDNTPSLSFSASGFNLTSFAFSNDLSGLQTDLNGDGTQDIFWHWDSGTQISGYLDAANTVLADRLTLSAPASIAADTSGSVPVTETLSAAVKNPNGNGAQVNSLGHVDVVATDT